MGKSWSKEEIKIASEQMKKQDQLSYEEFIKYIEEGSDKKWKN